MNLPVFLFWRRHDFLRIKILSLPICFTQKLCLDRNLGGARCKISHSSPFDFIFGRKAKTSQLLPTQTDSIFSDLKKLGALEATNRSMPGVMDGYHVSVHLRIDGKTHRFHFSNLSWFKRDELDGFLTDLFQKINKATV